MSSRDRLNRPKTNTPRARSDHSSKRTPADDSDQDFWDFDQEGYDDDVVEEELDDESKPQAPRRSRTPTRGGTANQIDQLRGALARGGGRSRQSLGRSHLARTTRESPPAGDVDREDEDDAWDGPDPGRQSRQPRERGSVRQHPHVREFWSDSDAQDIDDDGDRYYDDDDDFDEYDAPPRRTPLTQAPSIRLSRPNVTRPSMPAVISQADLVNDAPALAMIGTALLSLVGMAILVANRADTLTPSFATHVSASGVLEQFRGPDALWRIPLLAAMLTLMNVGAAWFVSPIDRFASRFLIAAAIIVQFVAWVALIRIL